VPIGPAVLQMFEDEAQEWAANAVLHLLRTETESIRAGRYYAWDVLAGMSLTEPKLITERMTALAVRKRAKERGRLVRVEGERPNSMVAVAADAKLFHRRFRGMLP
jgi:inosine-uridine nucleoside N-ribohydrolase